MSAAACDAAAIAREYIAAGWAVVPVHPRSKKPIPEKWQELRIAPDDVPKHFKHGENVGGHLGAASGGRVDVDLDCDEARLLASYFLPSTGARRAPR